MNSMKYILKKQFRQNLLIPKEKNISIKSGFIEIGLLELARFSHTWWKMFVSKIWVFISYGDS